MQQVLERYIHMWFQSVSLGCSLARKSKFITSIDRERERGREKTLYRRHCFSHIIIHSHVLFLVSNKCRGNFFLEISLSLPPVSTTHLCVRVCVGVDLCAHSLSSYRDEYFTICLFPHFFFTHTHLLKLGEGMRREREGKKGEREL